MAKEKLLDRFKKAMGVLSNNDSYQFEESDIQRMQQSLVALREFKERTESENRVIPDLKAREAAIAEREDAQQKRASQLYSRDYHTFAERSILFTKLHHAKRKTELYTEAPDISEQAPNTSSQTHSSDEIDRKFRTLFSQDPASRKATIHSDSINDLNAQLSSIRHNLPTVQVGFFDRFKNAMGILTYNSSYQAKANDIQQIRTEYKELMDFKIRIDTENIKMNELDSREAAIKQNEQILDEKDAQLARREAEIDSMKSELNQLIDEGQQATDLYREEQDMPQETPDFKVSAEALISKRLQDLQNDVQTTREEYKLAKEAKDKDAMANLKAKAKEIQGQFLATLMVYSETLNPSELAACQIGDKNIPLTSLLKQMPKLLGYVSPTKSNSYVITDKVNNVPDNVKQAILEQYSTLLKELFYLGVLKDNQRGGDPLYTHNLVDFESAGFENLLNIYCGTNIESAKYASHPLRNFTMQKSPEPKEEALTEDAPEITTEPAPLSTPATTEITNTIKTINKSDDGTR